MSNKALWDRVKVTDPSAVKPITGKQYKGNSPKPYWIVERLTDEFGPCGIGWGFIILSERMERLTDKDVLHIAVVRLWYVMDGKRGEFEQVGQTKAVYESRNGTIVDEDAPKKSVTDALVKCASYLGFAGDIFSGLWDDSKYVEWAAQEWDRRAQEANEDPRQRALMDFAAELVSLHEHGKDLTAIEAWYSPTSWSDDNPTRQEEQKFVWGQLKEYSRLRSAIKANAPGKEDK